MSTITEVLESKPRNITVHTSPSHDLCLVESDIPEPGPTDCLVHVRATGDNRLGHESSGIIVKTGKEVEDFKPGDRVAIECGVPCSKPICTFCRTGRYNACPDVVCFSTPPHHGTLRRYHVHPEAWLHKIIDNLTYEEGSLLEPLSVALAGIGRSRGCTGMESSIHAGIYVSDVKDTYSPIETSAPSYEHASRFGGAVFIIGVGKDFQNIPFMHLSAMEIDPRFQYRYHDTYPKAIRLASEELINSKPLVTHRFGLEQGLDGSAAASNPAAKAVKVQILSD